MTPNQKLLDWLDDLCVRFIVNLPHEELQSVERICFQIEEAQWFYEDFIRPLDPGLPSMNLRVFSQRMFQHCPLFANFTEAHREGAYEQFLQYKTRVPVRGAIMLNEEMTHAVLVKGWKKGAKWSFPRGKINKDEADLDCAVREVYEETGLDLLAIDLVKPEEEMKAIEVNMREQSLKLYVFRGVPMDTFFEPRTRKEISKIDWYKLGDLPTIRRKNQAPQSNGQDLVRDNSFYMVTPFVGPLKGWIKRQRQLDRQNNKAGVRLAPPLAAGITDTELEVDVGDTTADETGMPEYNPDSANFAELIANMGRDHRANDTLPELQTEKTVDPAAELKRLLSVGTGFPSQAQAPETQSMGAGVHANGMFDFLQGNNRPPHLNPITPFEQALATPQMPQSPHGQHHPRPPHLEHMPPPPHFPFHQQGPQFPGQQHPHNPPPPRNAFPPAPQQFFSPNQQPQHHFPPHPPNFQQSFGHQPQRPYQPTGNPQFGPQPSFQSQPGFQNQRGPAVPPASKLPPPKLTTHTLSLLNVFKMNEKPAVSSPRFPQEPAQSSQATPTMQQLPTMNRPSESYMSSPGTYSANPYAPSPPAFQSPPPGANFQPVQPKPRNAHQNSLLSLFSSPSMTAATPEPQKLSEAPAELSAFPHTPGLAMAGPGQKAAVPPMPDMSAKPVIMHSNATQHNKPGNTSATVRGPVNAPDFDTMKKNSHYPSNGNSRGPSPAIPKVEQKMFVPQQILRRENTPKGSPVRIVDSPSPRTSPRPGAHAAMPFKPQILKRPQPMTQDPTQAPVPAPSPAPTVHAQGLLGLFKSQTSPAPAVAPIPTPPTQRIAPTPSPAPSAHAQELLGLFKNQTSLPMAPTPPAQMPHPPAPAATQSTYDRRDNFPTDQKSALLSLFGKPSPKPSASPLARVASPHTRSPIPPTRSPQPPTPKNIRSGIISPVSPLPTTGSLTGSQAGSPADLASRSRISSMGDAFPPSIGITIPHGSRPTSHPATAAAQGQNNGYLVEEGLEIAGSGVHGSGSGFLDSNADKGKVKEEGKSPVDKTFLLGFLNDFANKKTGVGR
ncbi:hypothetical protein P280DRAFT_553093 [Massarina eburnea CBS 473.64]|uniref:Nudix hydrolase domain-containing protein n=1 Tax=Massarina eburnea CBS 473.64 TaxID=1395130 RepID=A0A6A6RLX9_9PLEO|nr:hypothetical protein P280DRAFT_553093 [Massarina eburnea CBS 473.64]